MKTKGFPFVVFPAEAEAALGSREDATRTYAKWGHESDFVDWYDALIANVGPMMTPGEVSLYVDVSRPAIHKRMQAGGITAFVLRLKPDEAQKSGKKRRLRASDVTYIPYSECQAWREERLGRLADAQRDEIETLEERLAKAEAELARYKESEEQRLMLDPNYIPEDVREEMEWERSGPSPEDLAEAEAKARADRPLKEQIARERAEAARPTTKRKGGKG